MTHVFNPVAAAAAQRTRLQKMTGAQPPEVTYRLWNAKQDVNSVCETATQET